MKTANLCRRFGCERVLVLVVVGSVEVVEEAGSLERCDETYWIQKLCSPVAESRLP